MIGRTQLFVSMLGDVLAHQSMQKLLIVESFLARRGRGARAERAKVLGVIIPSMRRRVGMMFGVQQEDARLMSKQDQCAVNNHPVRPHK